MGSGASKEPDEDHETYQQMVLQQQQQQQLQLQQQQQQKHPLQQQQQQALQSVLGQPPIPQCVDKAALAGAPNGQPMTNGGMVGKAGGVPTGPTPGKTSSVPKGPPPALPPSRLKEEVFRVEDYQHVDEHVLKTPLNCNHGTFSELISYLLSDPSWNDLAKVRAIFRWVTSMDVFNLPTENLPPKQSPLDYFYRIKNSLGNHARLFHALCKMASIQCEVISGMNKSAAYEVGKEVDRKAMGGQWNAVHVAGDWRFVDAFWASTCVVGRKSGDWALMDAEGTEGAGGAEEDEEGAEGTSQHRINEFYFLTNPRELVWTHFPDKEEWQLLQTPVTCEQYRDHFYVRERFHILGMTETPQSAGQCVLTATDGEVSVEFGLPPAHSANYRYKHMLYRSKTMSEAPIDSSLLDRFVFFEQPEDLLRLTLRFPIKGTFKLDIYGLDVNDSDIFDLCCSYIIECPQAKANCLPLPDCPALGWGPGQKAKEAGLKPVTHKSARVVADNGHAEVRLGKERALSLHQQLKHAVLDDATLIKYCLTRVEEDEVVIYLRLPQKGEYALKLFAQEVEAEGEADNVLNYLVQCQGQTEDCRPFPNTSHGTLGKGPDASRFGVQALTHEGGTLDAADGKVTVRFAASPGAELLCEVHTVDNMAAKHVTVARTHVDAEGEWVFDLDLPDSGEYSLNVFAKERDKDTEIFSVHTYLVQSDGYERDDCDAEEQQVHGDENNIHIETVETSDKEVLIPVPQGCSTQALAEFHRRNGQTPAEAAKPVERVVMEGVGTFFQLTLEDYGEYMMNVFTPHAHGRGESESGGDEDFVVGGRVRNVAKYQVNRRRPGELYSDNINTIMDTLQEEGQTADGEDPQAGETVAEDIDETVEVMADPGHKKKQEQCRKSVQQAMDLKDQKQLETAVARFVDTGIPEDDPVLVRARKLLAALQAKAELMEASQKREVPALEKALQLAREVNFEHQLDLQIAMAARLKEHLTRLEKLRHAVLNMEQKTVSEIKSYGSPPAGVHESMMATFLLLGSSLKEVKQWRTCQNLMSKRGKESMMRKISKFEPQAVPLRAAAQARKIAKAFTTDQIRNVSAGAATFYIWALGMIEEVESYGGAEKADQLRLQK
ncbi:uncharacterized protein LOC143294800 [Babylonia areolata]|uniref:uncharacterized protein LOC143294800 n=1 Tax=Babylonia areolata TaxID=304850 RepID=UPI003FD18B98